MLLLILAAAACSSQPTSTASIAAKPPAPETPFNSPMAAIQLTEVEYTASVSEAERLCLTATLKEDQWKESLEKASLGPASVPEKMWACLSIETAKRTLATPLLRAMNKSELPAASADCIRNTVPPHSLITAAKNRGMEIAAQAAAANCLAEEDWDGADAELQRLRTEARCMEDTAGSAEALLTAGHLAATGNFGPLDQLTARCRQTR